ncbi:hypothetical protein K504DRAFT_456167 [Pleomassaria siparia CBS 279.74]|uniref:Uncharacterized protein n=1 Tax=Pleomassaria siparia CBS 279.74 TaxID=1314801 RepID=A0A6G1K5G4_9PLEO|nr:hypothetical protein K504DRAFT_456167 [Pleomassaria siparia CBS 279.74]
MGPTLRVRALQFAVPFKSRLDLILTRYQQHTQIHTKYSLHTTKRASNSYPSFPRSVPVRQCRSALFVANCGNLVDNISNTRVHNFPPVPGADPPAGRTKLITCGIDHYFVRALRHLQSHGNELLSWIEVFKIDLYYARDGRVAPLNCQIKKLELEFEFVAWQFRHLYEALTAQHRLLIGP